MIFRDSGGSREHRPPWGLTRMSHHCQLNINSKRWGGIRISNASLLGQSWFIIFYISYFISYFGFFIFLWSVKHHIKDVPWLNGTICRPLRFRWIYVLLTISKVLVTRAAGNICTCSANVESHDKLHVIKTPQYLYC